MTLFTIGFTRTSAEGFFDRLRRVGVRTVVDVRLHNRTQLAGFAKRDDLRFFLHAIAGIGYEHRPELAPTPEILADYRKRGGDWADYERSFLALLAERHIEATVPRAALEDACLLCSEATSERCHRRLVATYLAEAWGDVEVVHL
jgi:uncharacterized protein (DUF488 family)